METILQHAQGLVYSLLCLMPSSYPKTSLKALLGLFLEAQGHALPAHTCVKSASSLSRFLNHYHGSTRRVIRTTRQAILQQIASHLPHSTIPIRILIDLTTLEKNGMFLQLSAPTKAPKPQILGYGFLTANEVYTWLSSIWLWENGECRGVFGFGGARAMPLRPS
jgi:hypothetical protein